MRPGFGRFTEAAIESIRRGTADALGTARDQLARRRVLGASFGAAQLAAIEQKGARDEFATRASALLEEIDQTFRIITQEFDLKKQNFQFDLDELGIAVNLTQGVMGVLSLQAEIDKRIAADAAAGTGTFFANTFGEIFGKDKDAFSFSDLFSSGGFANPDKALSALSPFPVGSTGT